MRYVRMTSYPPLRLSIECRAIDGSNRIANDMFWLLPHTKRPTRCESSLQAHIVNQFRPSVCSTMEYTPIRYINRLPPTLHMIASLKFFFCVFSFVCYCCFHAHGVGAGHAGVVGGWVGAWARIRQCEGWGRGLPNRYTLASFHLP